MRHVLNESIEQLNFVDEPDQSREHINHFIEEYTKNHIKNFLQPEQIKRNTSFAIVNAAYFNGQWVYVNYSLGLKTIKFNIDCIHLQVSVFDRESTVQRKFYKRDGEAVNVNMMTQTEVFNNGKLWHLFDRQIITNILTVSIFLGIRLL